ncbi:MAG: alpha-hydroxy acid oxidase, partial [Acidimicrobiales bacterium]
MDLDELEAAARRLLAPPSYDYLAGGAFDELTLAANMGDWARLRLRPRILRDVALVSTATTLLGTQVATPIGIAPTAFHRLAHPDGEPATAAAAAAAGALMVASTRATASVEEIADAAPGAPRWYQVYIMRDRDGTAGLVQRAARAGFQALVLTADTPVLGRRMRDVRNRFVLPANVGSAAESLGAEGNLSDQDPRLSFADIGWLARLSGLPVVVKG